MQKINHKFSAVLAIILILIASLMVFSLGCAKKEEKEIKIGAILPLTGPGAPYGQAEREGMEIAVNEINKGGGIRGQRLALIIEDSKTEPATGVAAINKLIQVDKTKIVLGALASSVTLAIAPIAEENKIVLITPGSSNPKISEAGDYIFRLYPSDNYQGKILAGWALKNKISKVGVIYINNDFGVGLKEQFKKEIETNGGKIVIEEGYEQGGKDFRSQLAKIKAKEVDGIFIIAAGQENANILIQAKEMGVKKRFFAPDAFKDENILKVAGNASDGVVCSAPRFSLSENRIKVQEFLSKFKESYKKEPNVFAAYGYDAVSLIADLLGKYKYDSTELKNELYKVKYEGVIGEIAFDKNGDLIPAMDFYVVKEGRFQLLEQ